MDFISSSAGHPLTELRGYPEAYLLTGFDLRHIADPIGSPRENKGNPVVLATPKETQPIIQ
jgi:hypothetical protein